MGLINYLGDSKIIKRICQLLNVTDVQDGEGHSLVDENGIAHVTGGGGGSSTLAGLSDVDVTGAQSGDVLSFNGADWVDETLARVATSGSYNDLLNKPTIPAEQVNSDWNSSSGVSQILNKPTKLSDFNNDSGFITNTVNNLTNYYKKSETYTQAEVDALISAVVTIDIEVVQALPTTDISTTTIYLLPKQTAGTDDVYDEYINTTGTSAGWELIGSTQIDLSNYYTKSEVDALIPDELADLSDDSTHRLVTDTEKTAWSNKSVVSANPQSTTGTLSGLEIDGVGYAVASGGHAIKNDSGTTLANKSNLKFAGTYSSNVGDDTVVNITREMTLAEFNQLSADEKKGFIDTTDEPDDTLADVAVTGEYSDLLNLPTIPNNTNQLVNGAGFITSSDNCAGAELANRTSRLDGFASGGAGNFTWGNQTGTGIWRNNDGSGGEFGFRKDNPSSGQVSMVIDGTVYVDEGRYSVIHSGNIGSQSVASAGALSGFIFPYSRVTNATSEFTFDFNAQKLYVIVVSGNGGGGSVYLNPSIYLAACNENNTTGSLWYAAIKTGGSTITSATRAQTGTNKFTFTANTVVRWAVFPFLA